MSEISDYFSARLKAARGDKSQNDFADHLGIVQQSYSRYERGTVPDGETLLKIASKLGTTIELLLRPAADQIKDDTTPYRFIHEQNVIDSALGEVQTIRDALNDLERKLKKMKL